jgi:hypothetical protein
MAPEVHIYPLSRLVHAPASDWVNMLTSLEEGKDYANRYYLPLREAIAAFCAQSGKGRSNILSTMITRALALGGTRGQRIARDNEAAFGVFESSFYPNIKRFHRSLLRDQQPGCKFEGIILIGTPHLLVTDQNGSQRYVFLHAAAWDDADLKAYLELLSIIIAQRFQAEPNSMWCMNLRLGKEVRWRPSVRIRRRCAKAARLYARLVQTIGTM